uniref:Uncharacterized protein n=1 Tax=Rhizophora mucronata TaxID=61149 RepID=A0A2P2NPX5_RHIMU
MVKMAWMIKSRMQQNQDE